jgi:hypothetical protein
VTHNGDRFEARVYSALHWCLQSGRLGLLPGRATLHRHKRYYSKDRQSSITTDVSIEVSLERSEKPLLIWVFECKSYRGAVPVDDLEEFHAKLQQIGEDNTKGTLVTDTALQRGALSYAQSKGIGVIRLLPDDQISHVLYQRPTEQPDHRNAATDRDPFEDPGYIGTRSFFGVWRDREASSWESMMLLALETLPSSDT